MDPKSKEDKVKVTHLKNLPKFPIFNFEITLYTTLLLELLDKMYKYEMDPTSIVEDTERTRFCPQMDRWTRWNEYTPTINFVEVEGIMTCNLVVPSHYLNQCWNIVNWTLENKHQWNLNRNSYIFIQENAFENIICEMVAILYRLQCVNFYQRKFSHLLLLWQISIYKLPNYYPPIHYFFQHICSLWHI